MRLFGTIARLAVLFVFAFHLADARASSAAGIEINVGKFRLQVHYSVALEYDKGLDRFIRDPRFTLFTVAAFLQANAEGFSGIERTVLVELDMSEDAPGNILSVVEDPYVTENLQREYKSLYEGRASEDIAGKVLEVICSRYAGACKHPAKKRLDLYECKGASCPGQIRFGSFPSDEVNNKFGLVQPAGVKAKHHTVTRNGIGKYYVTLEP